MKVFFVFGLRSINANVWRYVQVGAVSRWHAFLPSCWHLVFFFSLQSFRGMQKPWHLERVPRVSGDSACRHYKLNLRPRSIRGMQANCIYRPVSCCYYY